MKTLAPFFLCAVFATSFVCADEPQREWPFAGPVDVLPPSVQHTEHVRNEIDRFILAKLEAKGLKPAPVASKRTLLRRIYFDLIGLPPSPDEVKAFLNDEDSQAYEKVVDRLLKDSRYGERWARFWLDLARYADTAGYEGDPDLPYAWRYRDYVIDAFNNDKRYDLFIKEQIAGDEFQEINGAGDLPDTPPERLVAMTFLRLAPFTEPRGDESRHELLSEMTDTVSSVFLGLTVGCAKCHDHKYDPIPTKDFYRMKAFFATVALPRPERGDGAQIGGPLPADFYRPNEEQWVEEKRNSLEQQLDDARSQLAELNATLRKRMGHSAGLGIQTMGDDLDNDYFFDQVTVDDGKLHWNVINSDGKGWTFFTDGKGPGATGSLAGDNRGSWFGDLKDPQHISLGQYAAGSDGIASRDAYHVGSFAEVLIYDHVLSDDERTKLGKYVEAKFKTGGMATPPQKGLQFWLDAANLDGDVTTRNSMIGDAVASWTDRISGTTLSQSDEEMQPKLRTFGKSVAVAFDNDFLVGPIGDKVKFLENQQGAIVVVYTATHEHEGYGFHVGGDGQFISTFVNPTAELKVDIGRAIRDPLEARITDEEREQYRRLTLQETFVPQHLKRLRPMALSLRHSYGPPYEPGVPTSRVMIRGEYDKPGEVVEPGFLSCITGHQKPAKIRLDPFKRWPTRSRRMALAQWIASAENPLTARVMVNRLWHWHFGRGIVPTPSDFGKLSDGPSHPQLLDWLAKRFVEKKWSIKAMHRLIVTSNVYRQTSRHKNEAALQLDPENEFLWRFRSRRLEAEAVRDNVLAVSGRLNSEQFGLPIFPPLPNDIEQRVKYDNSKWATQYGPEGRRRSIYIYQQRTLTMPMMQAFDSLVCDQSRPKRRTSVTPLQSLAMYNGDFVNGEAKHFAARVRKLSRDNVVNQIRVAFELAFHRPPSDAESQHFQSFFEDAGADEDSLVGLCRILYNSNEFLYVD